MELIHRRGDVAGRMNSNPSSHGSLAANHVEWRCPVIVRWEIQVITFKAPAQ